MKIEPGIPRYPKNTLPGKEAKTSACKNYQNGPVVSERA
jgi:hypothetical protein